MSNDAAPDEATADDGPPEGDPVAEAIDLEPDDAPIDGAEAPPAPAPEPEPEPEREPDLEPEPRPDAGAPAQEASEPWVSHGWTTDREPPGPDEVPLPHLPPPAADAAPPSPVAPRRRPTRRPRLLIAAVLVAILASGLALAQAQDASDLRDQRDDQRAITEIAGRFGAAYLSFDYAHAEASGKAVTALATKALAESYVGQSAPGIQQLFSSGQTTTKATTTAVYLGEVEGSHARALVVVDVTANSPTDGKQQLDDVSFVLDLQRTGDGWRVAKVARAPQPELATTTTVAAP